MQEQAQQTPSGADVSDCPGPCGAAFVEPKTRRHRRSTMYRTASHRPSCLRHWSLKIYVKTFIPAHILTHSRIAAAAPIPAHRLIYLHQSHHRLHPPPVGHFIRRLPPRCGVVPGRGSRMVDSWGEATHNAIVKSAGVWWAGDRGGVGQRVAVWVHNTSKTEGIGTMRAVHLATHHRRHPHLSQPDAPQPAHNSCPLAARPPPPAPRSAKCLRRPVPYPLPRPHSQNSTDAPRHTHIRRHPPPRTPPPPVPHRCRTPPSRPSRQLRHAQRTQCRRPFVSAPSPFRIGAWRWPQMHLARSHGRIAKFPSELTKANVTEGWLPQLKTSCRKQHRMAQGFSHVRTHPAAL